MNTPPSGSAGAAPEGLRDALLTPRHLGKVLEVAEGLRQAFYALYEFCMGLAEDVRMTDNQEQVHFKQFIGSSKLFAKVKIRPKYRKMNLTFWGGSPASVGSARDVHHKAIPREDCELEIRSVAHVELAKPHIMESFRIASIPSPGKA